MHLVVAMSTFNGSQYLRAQLDSIFQQTLPCDLVLIRDDGSVDETVSILEAYQRCHPNLHIIKDNLGNIGVRRSYSLLLQAALSMQAQYVMFSDQDDVWLPEKAAKLMQVMQPLDAKKPALVFSDVTVTDSQLNVIASSFNQFQKLNVHANHPLKALLLYSPALGCTMLFNHALLKQISEIKDQHPNPDKWALLMATIHGQVGYLPESTVYYRQHGANVAGALRGVRRKIFRWENIGFLRSRYQTAVDEARILEKDIPALSEKDIATFQNFILLFTGNYWQRVTNYFRFWLIPPSISRKMGLFLSLFLQYSDKRVTVFEKKLTNERGADEKRIG